ncbi:glucose-6-phosphatase 3 [Mantella aurantiaca]
MDDIHTAGVAFAGALQERLHGTEEFWLWLTYLGDPGTIFLLYFPLAHALQHRLGETVLWLGLISEWLNLVFKWFLFGERPFWWIHESGLADIYKLKQFPSTCETGPGSPSGHCMITGAALWPIFMFLTDNLQRGIQRYVPLLLYVLLMLGIAVSRLFILAHFPHQVLAGIVFGVLLGHILKRSVPRSNSFLIYTLISLFLLLGALLIYEAMHAFGVDLSWSINLATKWCSKSEWIRPETRPFSSLSRSAGNALGLGFALCCPLYQRLHRETPGWRERVISLLLSVLFLNLQQSLPIPTSPYYYTLNLLRHAFCPPMVIILVPYLVSRLYSLEKRKGR